MEQNGTKKKVAVHEWRIENMEKSIGKIETKVSRIEKWIVILLATMAGRGLASTETVTKMVDAVTNYLYNLV